LLLERIALAQYWLWVRLQPVATDKSSSQRSCFCGSSAVPASVFPTPLWNDLANTSVTSAGADDTGGSTVDSCE
jgi:hypothetical protein